MRASEPVFGGPVKRLVEFSLEQGGSVLVEVDESPAGPVTRGLGKDRLGVAEHGDKTFEPTTAAVAPTATSLIPRLRSTDDRPDEIGVEFGVQLSAQEGAFIASWRPKLRVSMTWRGGSVSG